MAKMNSDLVRLKDYLNSEESLRVFLKWRDDRVAKWELVSSAKGLDFNEISSFIVAYPSGEILDEFKCQGKLPDGLFFMDGPTYQDDSKGYAKKNVDNKKVKILHGDCLRRPNDPEYYSTTITNTGNKRIRVYKFAPFLKRWGLYYQENPGGGYYSPRQFLEWFRVRESSGWIGPGDSVTDPDNWGIGWGMWVFFFEEEKGKRFIATTSFGKRNFLFK